MADLCVGCCKVGHSIADCLELDQAPPGITEYYVNDQDCESDFICDRCSDIDILGLLSDPDIRDELVPGKEAEGSENARENDKKQIDLGVLRSLRLVSSCPICRLIYSVFPSPVGKQDLGSRYHLRPFRGYNMLGQTLASAGAEVQAQYAVYASVESREEVISFKSHYMGDQIGSQVHRVQKALALSRANPAPNQPGLAAQARDIMVNFDILNSWMDRCQTHDAQCHVKWSDQLLICRMVDVAARKVVDCPRNCRYAALSYMWGGICPQERALEDGKLPQTIEDAITVTKRLGIGYLWVDALCIDQFPSNQQNAQLGMMDMIYSCAWVTIVALHGTHADAGLRGVSAKAARPPQAAEMIQGKEILTLFSPIYQEVENARYNTRAWTFQEFLLSPRRLLFGQHEAHYLCNTGVYCESIDSSIDPANILDVHRGPLNDMYFLSRDEESEHTRHSEETRRKLADEQYRMLIEMYTQRDMTNDADSLHAALGILERLRKSIIPQGFVFGLPLAEYPQALRWFHPRDTKPRRRSAFPSWSFVGWQGRAVYNEALNLVGGGEVTRFDESVDMAVRYVGVRDNILSVEGNVITVEIRNEPFNDAYIPGTDILVGMLHEGNQLHKNTLPAGVFDFLVVERLSSRAAPESRLRHTLYLIMLEEDEEGSISRRAMVRLFVEPGFETQERYHDLVKRREIVNLV